VRLPLDSGTRRCHHRRSPRPTRNAAAPVSIEQPAGGNYVRFMLDGGSGGSIVPLVIALDQAEGSGPARDVSQLLDQAFERLDKDGDGVLTKDEFSAR